MSESSNAPPEYAKFDANALYREEIYTDRATGTLRVLQPVTKDGKPDPARPTLYLGEAQILTNMGPLPVSFEIEASSLADAIAHYATAAQAGIERAVREIQELRRQASSSIVLPGASPSLAGGLPGGALGGASKIKLP